MGINVGGAGVRIGEAATKQYMFENDIGLDGTWKGEGGTSPIGAFFEETRAGQFIPRQLSVDLDGTSLDAIREGSLADVYHPEYLLGGKEDAANNFARGYYSVGKEMMDQVSDGIRKLVDNCENVQGFIVNHSLGGGTGSGLGALVLERLAVDYRKKTKVGFEVFGNGTPCQTYSEVLATHWLLDHTDVSLLYDNRQVSSVQKNAYKTRPCQGAPYENVNSFIARIAATVMQPETDELDHHGVELQQLNTDLVPFPRLHFMTTSLARDTQRAKQTTKQLMQNALSTKYMALGYHDFDVVEDKYMAVSLRCRGDFTSRECNQTVQWLKQTGKLSFVEWCPTGIKVSPNTTSGGQVEGDPAAFTADRSVSLIGNNVAVSRLFTRNCKRYDMLYSQRAYVHLFVAEGMEEGELSEAREDLGFLEKDYLDVLTEQTSDDEDDDEFR